MKLRMLGCCLAVALAAVACGSSGSNSTPDTTIPLGVDAQAAAACAVFQQVVTDTGAGKDMTPTQSADLLKKAGVLIRTSDGRQPANAEETPKWHELGQQILQVEVALASKDTASASQFTPLAQAGCATVPQQ